MASLSPAAIRSTTVSSDEYCAAGAITEPTAATVDLCRLNTLSIPLVTSTEALLAENLAPVQLGLTGATLRTRGFVAMSPACGFVSFVSRRAERNMRYLGPLF